MSERDKRLDPIAPQEPFRWSRRSFASTLVALAACIGGSSRALAQLDAPAPTIPGGTATEFEWELPRRYAPKAAGYLGLGPQNITRSPNDKSNRGLPILVIIAGVVALVYLADAIVRIYRDLRYGGVVIEDDGHRLHVRNDPRLPGRMIIIRDKNGHITAELKGEVQPKDLLRALPRGGS